MKAKLTVTSLPCSFPGNRENCMDVVMVYSDRNALRKGMEISERVFEQFRPDCTVKCTGWAMELLKDRELFDTLCQRAAEADMVFVAVPASLEMPDEMRAWVEAALADGTDRARALVALLGTEPQQAAWQSALDVYLREKANEAGLEYFSYWYQLPRPVENCSIENIHKRATAVTPVMVEILERIEAAARWGINE